MYLVNAHFKYQSIKGNPIGAMTYLINRWRENGQIIGRENPIILRSENHQSEFIVRVLTPEQDSLMPEWNSDKVNDALSSISKSGIEFSSFEILGRDYNAETTAEDTKPTFQILYTTYLDTCSPLYSGDTFEPIPLYQNIKDHQLNTKIIRWQEDWQACDQLQMNGNGLESVAVSEISDVHSELSVRGRALCEEIEKATGIPTYYYLYRLGTNEVEERNHKCPLTGQDWLLAEPLHDIFYFKCDESRLVSNMSWELD